MSKEGAIVLEERIKNNIEYLRKEYDMTVAEVVGVLMGVTLQFFHEEMESKEDD